MPTHGGTQLTDDPRWGPCMARARLQLLDEGWIERSKKFSEVRHKRAVRMLTQIRL